MSADFTQQNPLKLKSPQKCLVSGQREVDHLKSPGWISPDLYYRISKNENRKCYILMFTCAASRAIHLEVIKSQTAEEFQRKLNAFISGRSRPRFVIPDKALTFKVTAEWVKKIRKSEILQNHLANEEITWQFNLGKSPWWGSSTKDSLKKLRKRYTRHWAGRICHLKSPRSQRYSFGHR